MQKAPAKITIIIFLILLCSSCGYKLACNKTISVPFISGDYYGSLTNEVIRRISKSNYLTYSNFQGDYTLEIKIIKLEHEKVGYRKDQEKDFTLRNNIIASEGRLSVSACVSILDKDCKLCLGPKEVSSYVDYDYVDENSLQDLSFINEFGERITVLDFSIGQLESEESARYAAEEPLFSQLAKKIIDVISIQW